MALVTTGGLAAANAGVYGFRPAVTGQAYAAADFNATFRDALEALSWAMKPGIVAGGVCTASGLNVTIPSGTIYFARAQWYADGAVVVAVSDNATTYLWGCADGAVRSTSSTTPPTSWDATNACILGKFTASSGTVTVDLTIQSRARYAGYVPFTYENWHQDNMTTSQTGIVMAHYSGAWNQYSIPMRAGYCTALQITTNGTWSAGACTAVLYINGVAQTLTATIDVSNPVRAVTFANPTRYPFVGGDKLDIRLNTDGSWAPTTQDVLCGLETMQLFP